MLKDPQIRALKPRDRAYKILDGDGLYLNVTPSSARSWVYRYWLNGRPGSIGLGSYPTVSAKLARALRDQAAAEVAAGRKPQGSRALARGETSITVRQLAEQWFVAQRDRWKPRFRREVQSRLERDVFGPIGDLQAAEVTAKLLLDLVLDPLKARSHDLAQRCRQHLEAAFGYGIAHEIVSRNPALEAKAALGRKPPNGKRSAIIELDPVRQMLQRVETIPAFPASRLAHRLLALTAVRPGEVRAAQWAEFEGLAGDEPIWRIPEARMKMSGRGDFVVPLSRQAVEVVNAARKLYGKFPFVFPSSQSYRNPLCEATIRTLIRRAGYGGRHCAHGWRSAFSTTMNDRLEDERVIEACLAHGKDNEVAGRYNRGTYLRARRELMQTWADMLLVGAVPATDLLIGPRKTVAVGHALSEAA